MCDFLSSDLPIFEVDEQPTSESKPIKLVDSNIFEHLLASELSVGLWQRNDIQILDPNLFNEVTHMQEPIVEMDDYLAESYVNPNVFKISTECKTKSIPRQMYNNNMVCGNCKTTETTLWRRIDGVLMCNPCALYFKLHGCSRPAHLMSNSIRRRKRRCSNKL